jgi:hypothetical protein
MEGALLILLIVAIFMTIVSMLLSVIALSRLSSAQKILKNIDKKTVSELLSKLKNLELIQANIVDELKSFKIKQLQFLKSPKTIRFNAFEEKGARQSFVVGFLDDNLNGLILTSIYTRGSSRIYTKEISGGEPSRGELLSEEIELINNYKK